MRWRHLAWLTVCAVIAGAFVASAQTYPDRVIKIIVPFTPGSPVDAAARVLVQQMQTRLGQSIIIENRAGGGTTIGTKAVATAPPDGYTLLFNGASVVYARVLYPTVDFDQSMLAPIGPAVIWSHVIVVAPSLPVKTLPELVAYAKAHPGEVVFGFGQGTAPQILGTSLARAANIDLTMISYRGGDQARADLLGGRVHINIAPTASLLPLIKDGKARAVAFTGIKRSPDLPDIPTTAESGYPTVGYNPDVWLGLFAPKGTPAAIVTKLNETIRETLSSPDVKSTIATLGFEPMAATPEEFATFLAAETKKWPPLLEAAGMKGD
ncbi:MAG: Bug family tripartite tricarboxylate transporter substrate binding protein [Xanthobacteraceae bacterium]